MTHIPPLPAAFLDAITRWPAPAQSRFAEIRAAVLSAATDSPAFPLQETLKWGEPSWLPSRPRVGSTLRVAWKEKHRDQIGLFVNCQSTLASDIRDIYPDQFAYEKGRALWLALDAPFPAEKIGHVALMVLTYHLNKR